MRNIGPKCRLCRREGQKLFLKGERCFSAKCAITRRNYAPGQNGKESGGKLSEYGRQLREKQKTGRIYGVTDRQLTIIYDRAAKKPTSTGSELLRLLELRLDNVLYRTGLFTARSTARQFVLHGHVLVNGKRVNIPSYVLSLNDSFGIAEKKKKHALFAALEKADFKVPGWMKFDRKALQGAIAAMPEGEELNAAGLNSRYLLEYFSR